MAGSGGSRQPRLPGVNWHKGDLPREPSIARGAKEYARPRG